MQERISSIVGYSDAQSLWMGTFHSVFARILRAEAHRLGFPSNFTIYDTDDSLRLITQIIKDMQLDKDIYKPKQVQGRISSLKNNLITTSAYSRYPECSEADDSAARRPRLLDVYQQYTERCFKAGAMDFDDLLLRTNELLARFPEVLAKYQERFRYILVDEYQDTNHSQYLIVKALADRYENICVVGDDAQSIYSFRGANIANILHFNRDYPKARIFKLEQNYRSTQNIVKAADSVIKKNRDQLEKDIWTSNCEGDKVKVVRNLSDNEEGYYIARSIKILQGRRRRFPLPGLRGAVPHQRAEPRHRRCPSQTQHTVPHMGRAVVLLTQRKSRTYWHICVWPSTLRTRKRFLRVINYPTRGIGDTTLNKLTVTANHYNRSIFEVIKISTNCRSWA